MLSQPNPDPYLDVEGPPDDRTAARASTERAGSLLAENAGTPAQQQVPGGLIDGSEPVYAAASLTTSESEIALGIKFTPVPDPPAPDPRSADLSPGMRSEVAEQEAEAPRTSWTVVLLASYASALTLAVAWLLWTGRTLWQTDRSDPDSAGSGPLTAPHRAVKTDRSRASPPLPEPNLVRLGSSLSLGDLEVTPRSIVRRSLDLVHLEGATGDRREGPPSLVLTLGLRNRSAAGTFAPVDPAFVRDTSLAVDQSFIETPGGRRISMFRLATESEWSIEGQVFPTLKPGETAETIVVSEPVDLAEFVGPLVWHLKLRTSVFQTNVIGIRLSPEDVVDQGP
jgi:hypothetical protein